MQEVRTSRRGFLSLTAALGAATAAVGLAPRAEAAPRRGMPAGKNAGQGHSGAPQHAVAGIAVELRRAGKGGAGRGADRSASGPFPSELVLSNRSDTALPAGLQLALEVRELSDRGVVGELLPVHSYVENGPADLGFRAPRVDPGMEVTLPITWDLSRYSGQTVQVFATLVLAGFPYFAEVQSPEFLVGGGNVGGERTWGSSRNAGGSSAGGSSAGGAGAGSSHGPVQHDPMQIFRGMLGRR